MQTKPKRTEKQHEKDIQDIQQSVYLALKDRSSAIDIFDALMGMIEGLIKDSPEAVKPYITSRIIRLIKLAGGDFVKMDISEYKKIKKDITEKELLS